MGIFITALFSVFFMSGIKLTHRLALILLILGSFYVIASSGSQQGGVVAIGGIAIVIFFLLRSKFKNGIAVVTYLCAVTFSGLIAVLGMLQRGPLSDVLYKQSVSFRGEYWQAGINMGLNNPIFGVGLDSYGIFYRTFRNESATVVPGMNTISDAAHNIFLDVFASTGFVGICLYLGMIVLILFESLQFIKKSSRFDPIFVLLFSCWLGYQAQAVISINQIGIAVWGWIFGGLIIAYDKILKLSRLEVSSANNREKGRNSKVNRSSEAGISLATFVGLIVAMLIAMPPMIADGKWRNAMGSGDAKKIESAVTSWPQDPVRLNEAIKIFSDNKLDETALKLSKISTTKFSEYYISWYSYMQLVNITDSERAYARAQLHRLDPNNPEFKP